jgi:glycosyltransferase involved in cell wall biosynthesis
MDECIAVVSHTFPPDVNGQAIMLGRLLEQMPRTICLSSDRQACRVTYGGMPIEKIASTWFLRKLRRCKWLESSVFQLHVRERAKAIERVLTGHPCRALIACTGGDLVDLPASLLAAKQLGIPCILHYFDDYRSQWKIPNPAWSTPWMKMHGAEIESGVLEQGAGVIVPNELLKEELTRRTSCPVVVVRNPLDIDLYQSLRRPQPEAWNDPFHEWSMSYTGSVYEAQLDAVRNCGLGLDLLRDRGIAIRLHLYTSQSPESLWSCGIPKSVAIHPAVEPIEASRIQCESDLLLLPLAFHTRYPELIRTSSPGKLGEYLAAGRPILVHAPRDSFLAQFTLHHGCGWLCDTCNPEKMAGDLERLVRDGELRTRSIQRALAASEEFSNVVNRDKYFRFVSELAGIRNIA